METQVLLGLLSAGLLLAVVTFLARVENWQSVAASGTAVSGNEETDTTVGNKPSGLLRWLTTVDHRDIGVLYGVYSVIIFGWAGGAAMVMRAELIDPEMTLISTTFYNSLLTSHGIAMLILFGTPILAAFSNYLVPMLIGADDMAFPRINAIAFWLLPPSALLVIAGFLPLEGVIPAQTAWTMYTPLSAGGGVGTQGNVGVDLMLLGLHLSGISVTMGAINFIVTIVTERNRKVTWANLDILSWTILTQSGLILFAFPLLGSAILMLLLDRNFGTEFFLGGGDPILWQHLFWFWGHPEVYILILPAMGIVSYVLPRFAGRKLFGFKFVVYSTLAIGVLSFGVWAHHMFSTGIDPRLRASFMAISLAIAVPTAVKTFNWITTLWNGKLRLTTPMLFCVGFVSNVVIGGVTGVFLASIPVDLVLHDTYYVVGHFHYFLMGGTVFAVFAGIYYWFPLYAGRWYQESLGRVHFWLTMVGVNVTFFAMVLLGYGGMPRRYASYLPQFTTLHQVATFGAVILTIGQLIWLYNIVVSWREGTRIESGDPWNLADDDLNTAEWDWFASRRQRLVADGGEDENDETVRGD
ncbi:cbb3-type cytochrome c oxidase subunit I [Halobaculum sp. MBLA0147]|uniref:cbb3-type cytochrome c oxidase subunit I n=1 Tax=Halobaculum sp. MBLA0147 TaxID=3079934 RepID=UPI00352393CE